jgi:hypothetical protein
MRGAYVSGECTIGRPSPCTINLRPSLVTMTAEVHSSSFSLSSSFCLHHQQGHDLRPALTRSLKPHRVHQPNCLPAHELLAWPWACRITSSTPNRHEILQEPKLRVRHTIHSRTSCARPQAKHIPFLGVPPYLMGGINIRCHSLVPIPRNFVVTDAPNKRNLLAISQHHPT